MMSSPPNTTSLPSSSSFFYPGFSKCSDSDAGSASFTAFTCTSFLLLLPLNVLVLLVGVRQWWDQRGVRTVSPSDFLTYNSVVMEPLGLLASLLCCCGMYLPHQGMMRWGICTLFVVCLGRLMFQCLTCVERYVAVIHPITYLSLKTERSLKIRNGSIGGIWLLCSGMLVIVATCSSTLPTTPFFAAFASGFLVISFCSFSVLFALIRPGPGGVGGDRKRVHQSKRRAFLTMMSIMGVTFLKNAGLVVSTALHASLTLGRHDGCVVLMSAFWFCLPSSLLLPLLFLYRAGKLPWISPKAQRR